MCKNRVRGGSGQENAKYGAPRAPERALFKGLQGRVEGSSPHPCLEGQGEGRGAYSVLSSDVLELYVFLGYPLEGAFLTFVIYVINL